MNTQITIHNLSALPVIDYRNVKPLQGNLKDLTKTRYKKLLNTLKRRGFTTPLFIWRDIDDTCWLLDGHQRVRVMTAENINDHGSYEVPYVLIPAANLFEAKEQLLEITSEYGHMTVEGLEEFAFEIDLDDLDIHFEAVDVDKLIGPPDDEEDEDEDGEPVKVERYTTDQLRILAKSYHPVTAYDILEFLAWVDTYDSHAPVKRK